MQNQNNLYHTGVLGMRWGHRKNNSQPKITKSKSSKPNAKTMSDDELKKVVNRLQMEKQYSKLSNSEVSKGKKYAQNILKTGTTVATVTTTGLTIYNNIDKIKAIMEKAKK